MQGRNYIIAISLLLILLLLLNLPERVSGTVKAGVEDNLSPFHRATLYLAGKLRGVGWAIRGAWEADGTERALQAEIAELKRELWRRQNLETENRALRELVGFARRRQDRLVACEVVSRGDMTGWWQTVRLNRGGEDGLRPGLAVISAQGLVGRTTDISPHGCNVQLITDPGSMVACKLQRTGAFGILRGGGVSAAGKEKLEVLYAVHPVQLDYIPGDADVFRGEEVATSGLGGVYPEGLPVGRVKTVKNNESLLYQRAEVIPAADLRELRFVYVLVPLAGRQEAE